MKKFVKITFISVLVIAFIALLSVLIFVGSNLIKYSNLQLDENKLISPSTNVQIYDNANRLINEENTQTNKYIKLSNLQDYTHKAFISIEDKTFFEHNGLNYKRILKASLSNILSRSLKEGASTISQQLIKNTHLSSEKTFERKLKEIALTLKLEKKYTKNEILEWYLNAIYYGNNCYGIEEATNYYFSKSASKLTLSESAMLAGMIKSPSSFSPIINEDACLKRRNLVLDEMKKDGFITEEENERAKSSALNLNLQQENSNRLNSYSEAALNEACDILGMPAKSIAISGYKIHTYQNAEKQRRLEQALKSEDFNSADYAGIVLDSKKHAVTGYIGNSAYKILDAKRQPGSIIKPLLVYAPALNEDLISPSTQLIDEPLVLNDYTPKNVDGKYRGYVSAKEALGKSINIPAIKVLSYVGIDRAKVYATELGFNFDETDTSYALALGGMTYGENILTLASAYSVFPNLGKYAPAKFIEYITDSNGKIVYKHKPEEKQVFREDACFLLTTMLEESAENGTAKALKSVSIPLASKTGTVGKGKENLDAYNITYSPSEVCGVWVGNLDNTPINIAGGNEPTRCVREYFENCEPNEVFTMPESIIEREIDLLCLKEEHLVKLASTNIPKKYKTKALFSRFNEPREVSNLFNEVKNCQFDVAEKDGKVFIKFYADKFCVYEFYDDNKKLCVVHNYEGEKLLEEQINGKLIIKYGYENNLANQAIFEFTKNKSEKKEDLKSSKKQKWFV